MIRTLTKRTTLLAAFLLTAGAEAQGRGLLLPAEALPAAARTAFSTEIARARKEHPEAFARVAAVVAHADALDQRKRGRRAAVTPLLRGLGPDALWPMVSALAFAVEGGPHRDSARVALVTGLIEAAGAVRNPDVAPLWRTVLDGHEARFEILRAAAEALAKLDSDEAAKVLVALAKGDGVRRDAALAAMGHCRRLTVARTLAEVLDAHPAEATAKTVARSLGDVGNAWAWRTPAVKARSEEGAIRRTAAEALVRAFLAYEGEVRQAASNALMVVDAPETPALIHAAQQRADGPGRQALDALAERFAHNPAR